MNKMFKVVFTVVIFFLLIESAIAPLKAENDFVKFKVKSCEQNQIYLLRSEHYLYITASDDVDIFQIKYAFPPEYGHQVPIMLDILNDSTADILHYQIENDKNNPNKIINFTLAPMKQYEKTLIHFSFWVLVENHDFSDLPDYLEIPDKSNLPEEVKTWLISTEVVQADNILIKLKARRLKGFNDNLISFANRIAPFIKNHRYFLFVLQLNLRIFFSQDAITTLLINGENIGRSHLACAFFRSNNVPARVLLAHNDQGFWTQMHYMVEYYCPNYGWVLIDPTKGETPYETKRQIINRICYPDDENNTKSDYIIPFMKGEERWIWIDNHDVHPYYVDCTEGSKSQMFTESEILTTSDNVNITFNLTSNVFSQYQNYLGLNLSGENLLHFQNATMYQKNAIYELKNSDVDSYICNMNFSYNEYLKIII